MNKVLIFSSIVVVLLVGVSGYYFMNMNSANNGSEVNPTENYEPTSAAEMPAPTESETSEEVQLQITEEEVSQNSDEKSCWTIIDGKVYDVTSFISKHKGGPQKILSICGKDGSSLFGNQHGKDQIPQQVLSSLFKGVLATD